ncbi:MAG: hypothetical protein N2Z21_08570 [Candidatus Sumerlaeaceae bacterium]|nr:hypothetical protein [Candidatus Sumerlaeaceae bacterium]
MSLVEVRRLTEAGIEKFRKLCEEVRSQCKRDGEIEEIDKWSLSQAKDLLQDSEYTAPLDLDRFRISVDDEKTFSTQYDLAVYLHTKFPTALRQNPWKKEVVGLWEWIAILYAEQFRASSEESREAAKRRTAVFGKEDIYWIRDQRDSYVHNVFGCFALYATISDDDICKKLLSSPLGIYPDAYRELCKRQWVISCRSIVELAIRLYWDDGKGKWKAGVARDVKGGVRRLCEILAQFDYTYDLYSLTADKLWEMLPKEFDRFKHADATMSAAS